MVTGLLALAACSGDPVPPNRVDNHADNAIANATPVLNQAIVANEGVAPETAAAPIAAAQPAPASVSRETPPPPPPQEDYRAIGTEPFWAVIVKGSVATLQRPDHPPLRYHVSRTDDPRAVRFLGEGFTMTVTEGPCSDGMSDAIWSDRVQVSFGEGTLKGCGGTKDGGE
ncbi:membrane-like protein [Sphingobium sp. AP49]|uniref:COG3650 family protein n=1 Tax=Sphingobium sp. AP49 TaxID=1144307 RepID=UPI00026ED8C2|nr:hypothetical protein [Sphingobium sp. AP49]WHO39045.1 membrane-like protein [Sphingobium sp. AP49]